MLQFKITAELKRMIDSEVKSGEVSDVETLIDTALRHYFATKDAGFCANGPKALPGATSQKKLRRHYPDVTLSADELECERWKEIPGAPNFKISNLGRVRSPKKILKSQRNPSGYVQVFVKKKEGVGRNITVHRVVAQLFLPNTEGKPQVNHINGNKADCRLSNLEWVTPEENLRHAVEIGLRPGKAQLLCDK